jgi:GNAT superfamily N-acetyltransferase
MDNVVVRQFERTEADFAYEMMTREEWNTRKEDVVRMFDFEPQGCFMAEVDGKRAGHVFALSYGPLGWIGFLIIQSCYRRRGLGTMLMEEAISYLVSEGVGTVKLDAVPNIAGLYRKLGFVDEYDSLKFAGINHEKQKANNSSVLQIDTSMIPGISEFDAKCFGAERTRVLCRLFSENPDLSFVSCSGSRVTGYITCRRAVTGYNLGPWVCDPGQTSIAEALLLNCLKRMESNAKIFVGLPSPNMCAVGLLSKHGFLQYSKSTRMRLGRQIPELPKRMFAIAGPMKG